MKAQRLIKPTQTPETYPADVPALRVTETSVMSDGGSFVLAFGEYRAVQPFLPETRFADGNSAYVELARFAMSPVILANLKTAIAQAEEFHVKHFGPLPNVAAFKAKIAEENGPPFEPQAPTVIGFRKLGS